MEEDLESRYEFFDESERKFTILSIASGDTAEVEAKYNNGRVSEYTANINSDEISDNFVSGFYYHSYRWDEENSRIVLTYFDVDYYGYAYFLDPDWEVFNSNLEVLTDRTQIIDTVDTGTTTYEITLGDFLDNTTSYGITGIRESSETPFGTPSTSTKWTFNFDLSNVIYNRDYDYGTGISTYYPFSKYLVSLSIDYTKGGTLNSVYYTLQSEVTMDGFAMTYEEEHTLRLGGISAIETPYDFSYVLFALLLVPSVIIYMKKKKKKIPKN